MSIFIHSGTPVKPASVESMLVGAPLAVQRSPESLASMFSAYAPHIVCEPLTDFSGIDGSAAPFCQLVPTSLQEVLEIVELAARASISLRTRGMGHALNGSSLPRAGELSISTARLNWVRYEEVGTVSAGGGIGLWTLRELVQRAGFTLPVVNDGYAGPSVGGFVAAGGFGPGSADFGGFWENVSEICLATATGLQRIRRRDALFPWLFGSMGQFGIIVEARLDLLPLADEHPPYPLDSALCIADIEETATRMSQLPAGETGTRVYWFTLFVPPERLDDALALLARLETRHGGAFHYRERYRYLIRHRDRVVAPLIYAHASSFVAVGSWGFRDIQPGAALTPLCAFEQDFMALALNHGFRRYIQSELASGPAAYLRYFDATILLRFRAIKRAVDPRAIFNREWVFPYDPD